MYPIFQGLDVNSNSQYGFAGLPNPARTASDLAIRASKCACSVQIECNYGGIPAILTNMNFVH
jgi:hypothetical protein